MFRRDTGFDTAYVGSSNLSRAALLDGVEWNVRLSQVATPPLLDKFTATFDSYWNDIELRALRPGHGPGPPRRRVGRGVGAHAARSRHHLALGPRGAAVSLPAGRCSSRSQVERTVHDRHRNLVVAATGTGKTVVAALDYRQLAETAASGPALLFVAHRWEILDQSLRTYREVLGDASFGEQYVGGTSPRALAARVRQHPVADVVRRGEHPCRRFDIVVDRRVPPRRGRDLPAVLEHLAPKELLGLTATPERADGTRRPHASSTAAPPPSCGSGTRSAPTCCARSTTSPSPTAPTCRRSPGREARYDERRAGRTSTPATTPVPQSCFAQLRDKVARPRRDAGARLLRQRRARRVHGRGVHAMPASRARAVSGETPAAERAAGARGPARPARQRAVRRRPLQRGRRHPRRRHRAVPAADRERDGVPATARPWPAPDTRQGRPHGPRLRRPPPQGVPLRPQAAGTHRPDPTRSRARHRAGLPVPALGLPDRDGPAVAADRPREHPQPGGQPLAPDRRRAALVRRPGLADVPRRVRPRALRRPASRTSPGPSCGATPVCRRRRAPTGEEKLLKRVRAFAHVDDPERGRPATHGCCRRRAHVRRPQPASSGSPGCCSSRSGPTVAATTRTTRASAPCVAKRPRATSSAPSSTCPSTRARHVTIELERLAA